VTRDWIYIRELSDHVGETVLLKGWVYQKRSSGKIRFLVLRDGTGFLQCVAGVKDVPSESFDAMDRVTAESSIAIRGTVRKDDRAPGGFELGVTEFTILHLAGEYPIQPKDHGVEFLFDNRHLYLRSKTPHAALSVRNEVVQSCRDFLYQRDFVLIDSPILTPNACEGTSTLFETPYFDDKAYLAQSGQLYLEPACMAFGRVYCFGPTFRAEKSKTRRHLTEFWMIEPEVAYMDLKGDMDLAEESGSTHDTYGRSVCSLHIAIRGSVLLVRVDGTDRRLRAFGRDPLGPSSVSVFRAGSVDRGQR
jgi:asparaginyl-tRNA synthetase